MEKIREVIENFNVMTRLLGYTMTKITSTDDGDMVVNIRNKSNRLHLCIVYNSRVKAITIFDFAKDTNKLYHDIETFREDLLKLL